MFTYPEEVLLVCFALLGQVSGLQGGYLEWVEGLLGEPQLYVWELRGGQEVVVWIVGAH